jgi:hypothetical protein
MTVEEVRSRFGLNLRIGLNCFVEISAGLLD